MEILMKKKVGSIRISGKESDGIAFPKYRNFDIIKYESEDLRLPCNNPNCNNGFADLNDEVRKMITNNETEFSTSIKCNGYESENKSCQHHFDIVININYK